MKKITCEVDGCDGDVYAKGLCKACYSGDLYWKDRSSSDKKKRLEQLSRLTSRMSRSIKIRPIKKRNKKQPQEKQRKIA